MGTERQSCTAAQVLLPKHTQLRELVGTEIQPAHHSLSQVPRHRVAYTRSIGSFFNFTKMPYRLVAALGDGQRGRIGEQRRKGGQWKK